VVTVVSELDNERVRGNPFLKTKKTSALQSAKLQVSPETERRKINNEGTELYQVRGIKVTHMLCLATVS